MARIRVKIPNRSYPVITGAGVWAKQLPAELKRCVGRDQKLFVLFDARFYALHGDRLLRAIKRGGGRPIELVVPSGENAKQQSVVGDIYTFLLSRHIARGDFILACGGGVTSDLAGYVAATILRGVRWGVLSTTLLGQVDAAIGGKTGINHAAGKNLIGVIWQPTFVISDTEFLNTLPLREMAAGLGEVVKYAGLAGEPLLGVLKRYVAADNMFHERLLPHLVRLSAAYKADVVARDEREGGLRMVLNLGHTFGHALENVLGYGTLLHGEAILVGLTGALDLSIRLKPARTRRLAEYRDLLDDFAPLVPPFSADRDAVLAAMGFDKKRSGRNLRFVLLDSPGRPLITDTVPSRALRGAIKVMLDHHRTTGG